MSNFSFLNSEYPVFAKLGALAEQYYMNDAPTSISKLRSLCEFLVKDVYSKNEKYSNDLSLKDLIDECYEKDYIPEKIVGLMHTIRIKGNLAIHENKGTANEALDLLKYAHFISFWYFVLNGGNKDLFKPFERPLTEKEKFEQLKKEQDKVIAELKQQLIENQEELRKQPKNESDIIDFKKRSQAIAQYKQIELSEKQTRKIHIDAKLKNQGWEIINFNENLNLSGLDKTAVAELPTEEGFADYALFVKGKLLGFVEAKKIKIGAQNVIEQAKRYSKDSVQETGQWREYKVPFLYSTNGEKIFFLDVRDERNISRELAEFHTPNALDEFFNKESVNIKSWFEKNKIDSYFTGHKKLYPFQENAITSTENAICDQKHQMMLAMATGTGKTFTTVSLIYRLLESKAVKRVLFLVDRKALAAQAVTAFSSFDTPKGNKFDKEYEVYSQKFHKEDLEEGQSFDSNVLPNEYLTNPQGKHTFVYVSTIQRMTINLQGKYNNVSDEEGNQEYEIEADTLDIPIHAFDLIVVDECHRGYTSKESNIWRDTIKHFDATKIGLTATPALHTVGYFGEPIFKYSVEEAVNDGFLVDYDDPVVIKSGIRVNGVFLKEGEQVELVDTKTGKTLVDQLEDEREFASSELEKKITVPDSNRKIIKEIKKYIDEHEKKTGRFPKTLIFASNDLNHTSHADEIVKICKDVFNKGDDFVTKITGSPSVDRPLQKIREFRNRPEPKIVVTVDMLSTGVDVPEIEFIVFLRPVKSRILWEQMLGRGTRLCNAINKTHFNIVDCFEGTLIEYFKKVTGFDYKQQKETVPIKEVIEKIYNGEDREYNENVLIRRLRRVEKNMAGEAYDLFEKYIDDGDIGKFANELKSKLNNEFRNTMKILRDEDFQELLINYPKKKKPIKNSSINREVGILRKMMSIAVDNEWVDSNPCLANKVKPLREDSRRERFLLPEEEERLLSLCKGSYAYMKPILICALHTGMRKGEILNLTWDRVDLKRGFLHVTKTKTGVDRYIPISLTLLDELKKRNLKRISEYVFANPITKNPYYDLKRSFDALLDKAEIEGLVFHDLRHTAATRMVAAGIDLVVVKDILGHSCIDTTMRYSHPVPERKLQAVAALDSYAKESNILKIEAGF